jgi:hypothetical protein
VLELNDSMLSLEMRPRWLWRGFAANEGRLVLRSTDSAELFPVGPCGDSRYFSQFGGIGLRPEREQDWFFALTTTTSHSKRAILEVLQDAGFTVTWEEQPFPFDIDRWL